MFVATAAPPLLTPQVHRMAARDWSLLLPPDTHHHFHTPDGHDSPGALLLMLLALPLALGFQVEEVQHLNLDPDLTGTSP